MSPSVICRGVASLKDTSDNFEAREMGLGEHSALGWNPSRLYPTSNYEPEIHSSSEGL